MVFDINWVLVVPIRKKAERLFDALSSISRWNGPLRPSYRLRSLTHQWHAWNAVSRGLLWINTIVICVWWMTLWLKDGIVKQHQSLYFLLFFCGCHWRYNFTQFQPAVKVVTTNISVWMYFFFCQLRDNHVCNIKKSLQSLLLLTVDYRIRCSDWRCIFIESRQNVWTTARIQC